MTAIIKTKIIATVGPGTNTEEKIRSLIEAGAKIFRLNSSHESVEVHQNRINMIRKIAEEKNLHLPILLDLQGPKIRVGILKEPVELKAGKTIILKPGLEIDEENVIPVDYKGIIQDVKPGDKLLLDDGKIILVAMSKTAECVKAKVVNGGILTSKKGLNMPGATSSISAVTEKDIDYIKFAIENNLDYIALSFVRCKEDIIITRDCIRRFNGNIPIIAKIEKPQALENLDSIIEVSDGIMVARGDLGIEISPEKVPIAQKEIVKKTNIQRKPVIVATQMLESMMTQPIPTRAETSDVANAIIDGTDAVMLSGETAIGEFPVESIKMMQSIAENIESSNLYNKNLDLTHVKAEFEPHCQAMANAVIGMISEIEIDAIVVFTRTGETAELLAKDKPSVPIIAISDSVEVCRRLNLFWGVTPVYVDYEDKFTKEFILDMDEILSSQTFLKHGSRLIITGGVPFLGFDRANFVMLHKIGEGE